MDLWNNESEARRWIEVPAWVEQDISPATIAAIVQGGCASGAYMPAVTYYDALQTMQEHGNAVLDYLSEYGELPTPPNDVSWNGLAVHYLSRAVDLWATIAESELEDMDDVITPDSELFLSDARGVYIPRDFAESVRRELVENVSDDEWQIMLSGPEHEWYWDAWNDVEQKAVINDGNRRWTLYQDGDLWLIPITE